MPLDLQKVRRFVMLSQLKKVLEGQAELVGKLAKGLADELQINFEEDGLQNTKVDLFPDELQTLHDELVQEFQTQRIHTITLGKKGYTVYMQRKLWAKAKDGDKPRACETLKQLEDWADVVEETFNTQTLSARVRELVADEDGLTLDEIKALLPLPLQTALDVTEQYVLCTRKG